MQNQWDDVDYKKAQYLIENGYITNLDVLELAKALYNKRVDGGSPSHSDNVGLLGKAFE